MFKSSAIFFDRLMRRYTPDPFVLALMLTLLLFVLGVSMTPASAKDMVTYWGDGFWELIPFTLQMVMVLIGGYVVALAPSVSKLLRYISSFAKTPGQAIVTVTLTALAGSILNWGLGLVVGGLMCREIIKVVPKANFRLLVASAYSGFIVWHGGISGSIPMIIATPGNFSEKMIGGLIPISETLLSPLNITAVLGIFILLPLTNLFLSRNDIEQPPVGPININDDEVVKAKISSSPSDWIENSRLVGLAAGLLGFAYIGFQISTRKFHFNLNDINFIFLFAGIMLHGTPRSFIDAISTAAKRVGPILLQFPFYAGIMGMMTSSKLAEMISQSFAQASSHETFALMTFYSAGIVNLFIPSGGGQWAVQAPVVLEAARDLGVDFSKAAMAVAWGDAWTNLLQPFWALPILAIAGLNLRDIMGYCVTMLIVTGLFLSAVFLYFA